MFEHSQRPFEYQWALKKLPPYALKVLDIGCGRSCGETGVEDFAKHLCETGYSVTGIDIRNVEWQHPRFSFIHDNFLTAKIDGEFDIIVSFQVWQHVGMGYLNYIQPRYVDPQDFTDKICALLKSQGKAIITTAIEPSLKRSDARPFSLSQIHGMLKGKFSILDENVQADSPNTHLLLYLAKG